MILGIDFDNTIVCYDGLFYAEALKRKLISPEIPQDKKSIRKSLVKKGREEDFTILQGYMYGPGIVQAHAYQGVINCLQKLKEYGVILVIISHKTPLPYLGEQYDLHTFARNWLEKNKFHANNLIERENVFFEASKGLKLKRIAEQKCTHFIDDLPSVLNHPLFPEKTKALLFNPQNDFKTKLSSFNTWKEIEDTLMKDILGLIK